MALQELTEAKIPFLNEEVDLLSTQAIFMVVALILGFTIFNMADSIGDNLAGKVNAFLGAFLPGGNPATEGNENSGPAFGGA
jgi:hypothetical protein